MTTYPVCLVYVSTASLVLLPNRTCRPRPGAYLESSGLREVETSVNNWLERVVYGEGKF
jgi:hypothetical protein